MTQYLKKEEINDEVINEIANALKEGKLVIFPTDTVYGIGTNAYDGEACEKIYQVKGRPKYKPLLILISEISMLEKIVNYISPAEQKLIDTFWPGPLTMKFKKKGDIFPDIISAGDEYIRVRLIAKGLMHNLIQTAGVPIVAPSANLSGNSTGTKMENIIKEFHSKVDYILDYGDIENDTVSTIVQVEDEKVVVIREGKIKKEEIAEVLPLKEE